jgi:Kyakuja-Dileera-Zisupton transposase
MFALFAIAGIFLAVCRHGHVLVICDMIRSGELCVSFFVMFIDLLSNPYVSE